MMKGYIMRERLGSPGLSPSLGFKCKVLYDNGINVTISKPARFLWQMLKENSHEQKC